MGSRGPAVGSPRASPREASPANGWIVVWLEAPADVAAPAIATFNMHFRLSDPGRKHNNTSVSLPNTKSIFLEAPDKVLVI